MLCSVFVLVYPFRSSYYYEFIGLSPNIFERQSNIIAFEFGA